MYANMSSSVGIFAFQFYEGRLSWSKGSAVVAAEEAGSS
jgi:hypothetical protein